MMIKSSLYIFFMEIRTANVLKMNLDDLGIGVYIPM